MSEILLGLLAEFESLKLVLLKLLILLLNPLYLVLFYLLLRLLVLAGLLGVASLHFAQSNQLPLSLDVLSLFFLVSELANEHFDGVLLQWIWTATLVQATSCPHIRRTVLTGS